MPTIHLQRAIEIEVAEIVDRGPYERRTKVIGPMAGEQSGLSLIHAVLVDVSKRWRGIKLTPGDLEKLSELRSQVVPLAATG